MSKDKSRKIPVLSSGRGLISEQIHDWLLEQIQTWDISEPLPSQTQIMKDFGVSLSSVNTAFDRLVRAGLIERHRGRGSFITRNDVRQYSPQRASGNDRPTVVVVSIDYFSEVTWNNTHLCDEFLDRAGYRSVHLKLKQTDRGGRVRDFLETEADVAGVIIDLSTRLLHVDNRFLNSLSIPVVVMEPVDRLRDLSRLHSVHPDYEQSGFLMADELLSAGCRKIAYVGDIPENEVTNEHERGIRRAFKEHGLGVRSLITLDERSRPGEYAAEVGYRLTEVLLKKHCDVDGIIFDCAVGAFGSLRAIAEAGKRVPEDVSVIGEGDYKFIRFCNPPLTVTAFDASEWARRAVSCITSPEDSAPQEYVIAPELIRRDSVRNP
jgi:DNA-binding LacI/PurR family transcriptional regulator